MPWLFRDHRCPQRGRCVKFLLMPRTLCRDELCACDLNIPASPSTQRSSAKRISAIAGDSFLIATEPSEATIPIPVTLKFSVVVAKGFLLINGLGDAGVSRQLSKRARAESKRAGIFGKTPGDPLENHGVQPMAQSVSVFLSQHRSHAVAK